MLTDRPVICDYAKFRAKKSEELSVLLAQTPSVFLIVCTKCFHRMRDEDAGCPEVRNALAGCATTIAGCLEVDFLCNREKTSVLLATHPCGSSTAGVFSCGVGVQVVADLLPDTCVLALADSIPHGGNATTDVAYHGVSLRPWQCAACGQCRLQDTAGICPVVECAKSLVNGPCGGAKNGMCEVHESLPCAWERIYARLSAQGRQFSPPVQVHNCASFSPEKKASLSAEVRQKRREGFPGGLYPPDEKEQAGSLSLARFPDPQVAVVFLSQHAGAPARPLVKKGDRVKAGQEIAETAAAISAAVHAPIPGVVAEISERFHPSLLTPAPAVIIEHDGSGASVSLPPMTGWRSLDPATLRQRVRQAGIVGLGGAMFPSDVKLNPPRPVDTLIINGCECEPILSADNLTMVECADDLLDGAEMLRHILGVTRCLIAVEENKPRACAVLTERLAGRDDISVVPVKTKYPQGAERMLVLRLLGRRIPEGKLPCDAGAVVFNVSTAVAVCRAVRDGLPLIERALTVAGALVKNPANLIVKIGTPFADLLRAHGADEESRLLMGGPMMGVAQPSWSGAVIKGTTGLCAVPRPAVIPSEERDCIKCGRCVDACPMDLVPSRYAFHGKRQEWAQMQRHGVLSCIECGCCEYICSAKIALVSLIRKAKIHARHLTAKP
jgi:electron transport complex protein RnfC